MTGTARSDDNQHRRWFPAHPKPRAGAIHLFCIPHAGAGASIYRSWVDLLPPSVLVSPVQLRGREDRLAEPPQPSITAIADDLAPALGSWVDGPYVLFGYSMGALIAFETARRLRRAGLPMPAGMIVAAHRPPHCPAARNPVWQLPDDQFLNELRSMGGMSNDVLACAELLELVMPALRADFKACDIYSWTHEAPLDIPLAVFGGWKDPQVPPETLGEWRECSLKPVTLRMFPGGHFFIRENRDLMLRSLAQSVVQFRDTLR